ncbi:MAG: hypothetical protein GF381_04745 [Candidatus Pacebacteria bacterium]|nr:hypothetical protein [Candidatus Paceibacterota bacterium]
MPVFVFIFLFIVPLMGFMGQAWAQDVKKKPTKTELYKKDYSSMQNALKNQLKADIEGEMGNPSSGSVTSGVIESTQAYILLNVTGVNDEIAAHLSEEERLIAEEIYGDGIIGEAHNYLAMLYDKPASTTTYVADLFQSAKIIPQAQAQGLGFAALDPILSTWKTFRNVAYFFFVIIFLVIGFLIMFRQKIDGQTVVTAQQAIPSIIVAMLFVTFSYAIGGLLIDLMYLLMYFIVGIFQGSVDLIDKNILGLGAELISSGFSSGWEAADNAIDTIVRTSGLGDVLDWVGGLAVGVIVAVAVLFSLFKLFFELIKSYIAVIINIAFAPMILMIGAIPGKNTFNGWIKNIIGNLAPFPVLLLLLIMQKIIKDSAVGGSGGFMPPYLLNHGVSGAIPAIISVGILLVTPEILKKVKEAIGAKEGVFGELAGTAWDRFKKGVPYGTAPFRAAAGGGAGLLASKLDKQGRIDPLTGIAGGAFMGAAGRRGMQKGAGWLNKYGEFAENIQSLGYDAGGIPEKIVGTIFPALRPYIEKGRLARSKKTGVPLESLWKDTSGAGQEGALEAFEEKTEQRRGPTIEMPDSLPED